jgi:hypothetical protein
VLNAAGETEAMQENIKDWLKLDEGDPRLQILTEEEIVALIFFFVSTTLVPNDPFKYFLRFCL